MIDRTTPTTGARPPHGRFLVLTIVLLHAAFTGARAQTAALPPGIGLGGSFGVNAVGGSSNSAIGSAPGWEAFLTAGLRNGLYIDAGATLSGHRLDGADHRLNQVSAFIEPRWVMLGIAPVWAPFIGLRFGRTWEELAGRSYTFRGSGWSYGASGGLVYRVAPQIALEGGIVLGATRYDAYTFTGEFAWKSCLDDLADGTPLPASVVNCNGSRSVGGVVQLCYPPYYPAGSSTCDPPDIPYEGTGRTGTWLRTWVGVRLSFSTALSNS